MGRYTVAKRDIKQGEVIMTETPLLVGPKMITPAICLGCHRVLRLQEGAVSFLDQIWPILSTRKHFENYRGSNNSYQSEFLEKNLF